MNLYSPLSYKLGIYNFFFNVKINSSFSGWPCPDLVRRIKFKSVYCILSGLFGHKRVHSPLKSQWYIPDSLWKNQAYLSLFRRWLLVGEVKGEQGNGGGFIICHRNLIWCISPTFSHLRFKPIFIFERKFNPYVSVLVALLAFIDRK